MSQQAFYFDGTRCTGCKTCEMACKDFKDLSVGVAFRKVYEVTLGDTAKDAQGTITTSCTTYPLSMACSHCDKPVCVEVCPQGAIEKNADGLVCIDAEKCIGCGSCVQACPYNVPVLQKDEGKTLKCDGCADRVAAGEKPICVEACPARALDFDDTEKLAKTGERANIAPLIDPSETEPNFFIKASTDAQSVNTTGAEVVNPLEVA